MSDVIIYTTEDGRPKLIYIWKTARFGYLNQKLPSFFKPPSKISASTRRPFLTTKS